MTARGSPGAARHDGPIVSRGCLPGSMERRAHVRANTIGVVLSLLIDRADSGLIQLVRVRGHDEVVAVQALDLVRPPGDRRAAPLGQQRRVMGFPLRQYAHPVRERQWPPEVVEREDASQASDLPEAFEASASRMSSSADTPCCQIFLVELVIRLNSVAEETIRIEGLRCAALFWQRRAISAEAQLETARAPRGTNGRRTARWATWRGAVASLVGSLYAAEAARAHLERRYLERTLDLFPDLAADWQRLREQAERLPGLGDAVGPTAARVDGARHRQGRSSGRPAIDLRQLRGAALDRAPEEAASLVDVARAAALDALGDTDGAAMIAKRRLRSNAAPASKLA